MILYHLSALNQFKSDKLKQQKDNIDMWLYFVFTSRANSLKICKLVVYRLCGVSIGCLSIAAADGVENHLVARV